MEDFRGNTEKKHIGGIIILYFIYKKQAKILKYHKKYDLFDLKIYIIYKFEFTAFNSYLNYNIV